MNSDVSQCSVGVQPATTGAKKRGLARRHAEIALRAATRRPAGPTKAASAASSPCWLTPLAGSTGSTARGCVSSGHSG